MKRTMDTDMTLSPPFRIGNGYDVHRLAVGRRLVLGGVGIDYEKGCVAHSDGDAVLHSLCDAMLGALALGDIGVHFPDTSDEYRDIDSAILLKRTFDMIAGRGYGLGNADITIVLQSPKLASYIPAMRKRIAEIIGCGIERISIKATTAEHLGFVGSGEGVEVFSSVLLFKL